VPDLSIGDRLRDLRKGASLTQAALAAKLGCSAKRIANIEGGTRRPNLDLIDQWAGACGRRFVLAFVDPGAPAEAAEIAELPPAARRAIALIREEAPRAAAPAVEALERHVAAWRQTLAAPSADISGSGG
jgi:transcriptional regulator with XRE-family HTH domain